MKMFCPVCGKKSKGICIDCFSEKNPIELMDIRLSKCACGNYLYRGNWSGDVKDSVKKAVEKNITPPPEIKLENMQVLPEFKGDRIDLEIRIIGHYREEHFKKTLYENIKIDKKECPDCSRTRSGYYEAIIQFRISRSLNDFNPNPRYISKIKKVRGGFDLYITSLKYARDMEREFEKSGFLVGESSKLVGRKNGRDLYRISISVKESDLKEGDFLKYEGGIIQVMKTGKKILCRDIVNKKQKPISPSNLIKSGVIARKSDIREGIVTMISPGYVQILDLTDNETHELKNENMNLNPGQEIKILKTDRKIYVL